MPSSAFMCANFSDLKLFCIAIPCANLTDVHGVVHYERNISCKKKNCITYKPENSFILEIVCLNLND